MTVSEFLGSIQYMVDEDGKRTAAVVQIDMWQKLLSILGASEPVALEEAGYDKTPEQVMSEVQSRPVNSEQIILPKGSLLNALLNPTYDDEDFDLDEWTKQWLAIEQEMKAVTHTNDLAEGRI